MISLEDAFTAIGMFHKFFITFYKQNDFIRHYDADDYYQQTLVTYAPSVARNANNQEHAVKIVNKCKYKWAWKMLVTMNRYSGLNICGKPKRFPREYPFSSQNDREIIVDTFQNTMEELCPEMDFDFVISQMAEKDREIFLSVYHGESIVKIARLMGISKQRVHQRLKRAIHIFRENIGETE